MDNVYEFTKLNARVKIFHAGNYNTTVNIPTLEKIMDETYRNTYRYFGNLFDGLTIEIWDIRRKDIPRNVEVCSTDGKCYTKLGIANYAGLTSAWFNDSERKSSTRLIQLNSASCQDEESFALCLGHELGHFIDWLTEFNDSGDLIMGLWKSIRGKDVTPDTPIGELMAEDIMKFFGARGANGSRRTDKYNYRQPYDVRGLRDLLLIWKQASEYINSVKKAGSDIKNLKMSTSLLDASYCSIEFDIVPRLLSFGSTHILIDKTGIKCQVKFFFFNTYIMLKPF